MLPPELELLVYTVYDHPSDYPEDYVVRRWRVGSTMTPEHEPCLVTADLEALRRHLQGMGLTRIPPMPEEDPVILEVWI